MLKTIAGGLQDHPIGYGIWLVGILIILGVGGRPERLAGAVLLANTFGSLVWRPDELGGVFWHLLIEDLIVLSALSILLARYPRTWLLWACAIEVLSVVSHLPRLFDPSIRPLGYAWLETAIGYLLIAAVVGGALLEGQRHANCARSQR